MSSTVDKIKEHLNIVDVVGSYVKLERAGINFKARCPFHNEKTPSFFVSPARDSYHCFGCNRGGDIFSFVQEIEGLDFLGSLKILAERAGVPLEAFSGQDEKNNRLYSLMTAATDFYQEQLTTNKEANAYLKDRGVKSETISAFSLGYAPADWRAVTEHLIKRGYKEEELEKVGLSIQSKTGAGTKGSRVYDRFRGRIMFPLADASGRVVGFSGRLYPETNTKEGKYINSPQTPLYDKSKILYGYNQAKVPIRRLNQAVLVEGQMDLILSHQAGVENAVAVSGTALTEQHLVALKRLSPQVVMAFDQDLAGVNAARRAIDMAIDLGLEVRAALMPAGKDPADVVRENQELWQKAVGESKHVIDFYLAVLAGKGYDARALRLAVSKEVLPYIARLNNAIDQAHFVGEVAKLLNLTEEPIWQEVRKVNPGVIAAPQAAAEAPPRKAMITERLLSFYFWVKAENKMVDWQEKIKNQLNLETVKKEDEGKLTLEGELLYAGKEQVEEEIGELLNQYKVESLREEMALLLEKIKAAELAKDHEALDKYLKKCQSISQELQSLNSPN